MNATVWYEPELDKTYNAPVSDASPPCGECHDDAVSILAPKDGQRVRYEHQCKESLHHWGSTSEWWRN